MNEPKSVIAANQILSQRCQGQGVVLTLNCDWISTHESRMDLTNPEDPKAEGEGKFPNHLQNSNLNKLLRYRLTVLLLHFFQQQIQIMRFRFFD